MKKRGNRLKAGARFSLFITSYLPMFFIMVFRQVCLYRDHLSWAGLTPDPVKCFVKYFGAATFLSALSLVGIIGIIVLLKNMRRRIKNNPIEIVVSDIENKNSESISYLFTYIIPFVFQDLSLIDNVVAVFTLLFVTFCIYMHSSLILINPTISFWYSLYGIEYGEGEVTKKAMIITKQKYLEENDQIHIKEIGHKLYYAQMADGG